MVKYPNIRHQNHSQVTAYGGGNNYCHLTQPWIPVGRDIQVDVHLLRQPRNPLPHRFFNTFTNAG